MATPTRLLTLAVAALTLAACGTRPPGSDGGTDGGGGDVTPPTIASTSPAAGATGVPLDAPCVITFSEPMKADTVTVAITPTVVLGAPTFDEEGTGLTVAPAAALLPNTLYTVTLDGQDVAGNALAGLKTFSFTTQVVDVTAPTIASSTPAKGATGVAVGTTVAITFSEAMSVGLVTVDVSPIVDLGSPTWNAENTTVTFTPPAPLAPSTLYTLTLAGEDRAGNGLAGDRVLTFTTGALPDTTPPTITDTSPGDGDTGVSNNTLLTINFSEPMQQAVTAGALALATGSGTPLSNCDARWLWNAERTIVSCQPSPVLAFSTAHRVTVGTAAKDDAGNALAAAFVFTFTTGSAPDTTPPTVSSVTPTSGTLGVERDAYAQVTFSEPMDVAATQGAYACMVGSTVVGGNFSWFNRNMVMRFTPTSAFAYGTTVACTVRGGASGARDVAGNRLVSTFTSTFRVLRYATVMVRGAASLDGTIFNSGSTQPYALYIYVGDTASNLAARGFFEFDLTAVPADVRRVTGATMNFYLYGIGGDLNAMGTPYVEHVNFGATLDNSDYALSPLAGSPAVFATTIGARLVWVTAWVQDDITNRVARGNRSEFRMRFPTEVTADGAPDALYIGALEYGTEAMRPFMEIGYEYP